MSKCTFEAVHSYVCEVSVKIAQLETLILSEIHVLAQHKQCLFWKKGDDEWLFTDIFCILCPFFSFFFFLFFSVKLSDHALGKLRNNRAQSIAVGDSERTQKSHIGTVLLTEVLYIMDYSLIFLCFLLLALI